jgi:hypothetical protein
MDSYFTYNQENLIREIESFEKFPSSGINLDILTQGIQSNELSSEQQLRVSNICVIGYNNALRSCFPKDAFRILKAQNIIFNGIPSYEEMDLDKEWQKIAELTGITIPQLEITTEFAFKHFKNKFPNDFVGYEEIYSKISLYISECIRRAHFDNNPQLLEIVIPTFKVLAYFHKIHEWTHYSCSAEFNAMVRFGVDREKMQFINLREEDIKEKFMED